MRRATSEAPPPVSGACPQAKALARRPHVVIATPGRLKVGAAARHARCARREQQHGWASYIWQQRRPCRQQQLPGSAGIAAAQQLAVCPPRAACRPRPQGLLDADASLGPAFSRARFLVLDEADRLLEPSFEPELETVLSLLPEERQTLLFSATMTKALVALQKVGRWAANGGVGSRAGELGVRSGGAVPHAAPPGCAATNKLFAVAAAAAAAHCAQLSCPVLTGLPAAAHRLLVPPAGAAD